MKLEEFMQAHEGETGMTEKLNAKYLASQGIELSDEELDHAIGGSMGEPVPIDYDNPIEVYRRDSKGNPTHWHNKNTGKIYYYACPRCGRVTHKGTLGYVYCDPCDAYWCTWSERRVYIN